MQNKLLIIVLGVSVLANVWLSHILLTHDSVDYKAKYSSLKTSYVSLAKSQTYLLDIFMKNQVDLKKMVPEYKDLTKEQFDEATRRKIIRLEIEIKDLEKLE